MNGEIETNELFMKTHNKETRCSTFGKCVLSTHKNQFYLVNINHIKVK